MVFKINREFNQSVLLVDGKEIFRSDCFLSFREITDTEISVAATVRNGVFEDMKIHTIKLEQSSRKMLMEARQKVWEDFEASLSKVIQESDEWQWAKDPMEFGKKIKKIKYAIADQLVNLAQILRR